MAVYSPEFMCIRKSESDVDSTVRLHNLFEMDPLSYDIDVFLKDNDLVQDDLLLFTTPNEFLTKKYDELSDAYIFMKALGKYIYEASSQRDYKVNIDLTCPLITKILKLGNIALCGEFVPTLGYKNIRGLDFFFYDISAKDAEVKLKDICALFTGSLLKMRTAIV